MRRIDRSDLPALRSLLDDCFGADHLDEHLPDQTLAVPGVRLLAVLDGGGFAATVATRPTCAGALLFSLATARPHRRKGPAGWLVAEAGRSSARHGASHLRADVSPDVLPFYRRLGFCPDSRWRRYQRSHDAAG